MEKLRIPHAHSVYEQFDARRYLITRFSQPRGSVMYRLTRFYVQCYHDFYRKFHTDWDTSQARVLELGGGPAIYPLISAVPFVAEINFTDYSEANRKEVLLWKNKDPCAYDWAPYFKHVVNTLEGVTDPVASALREEELRRMIQDVAQCDLLDEDIVSPTYEPFDIISCNLCCDAVSKSTEQYIEVLKKIGLLLKPNGYLTSLVCEGAQCYAVGETTYRSLFLTVQDISDSHSKAGYTVKYSSRFQIPEGSRIGCTQKVFSKAIHFIVAQKL